MSDDNEDDLEFGEELLAIDVDSLVAARETQRVEQVHKQLKVIVATLENSHTAKSLPLTAQQLKACFSHSLWLNTYSIEMGNVRRCVIERKLQLLARNKKLVQLDTELYKSFAKGNSEK